MNKIIISIIVLLFLGCSNNDQTEKTTQAVKKLEQKMKSEPKPQISEKTKRFLMRLSDEKRGIYPKGSVYYNVRPEFVKTAIKVLKDPNKEYSITDRIAYLPSKDLLANIPSCMSGQTANIKIFLKYRDELTQKYGYTTASLIIAYNHLAQTYPLFNQAVKYADYKNLYSKMSNTNPNKIGNYMLTPEEQKKLNEVYVSMDKQADKSCPVQGKLYDMYWGGWSWSVHQSYNTTSFKKILNYNFNKYLDDIDGVGYQDIKQLEFYKKYFNFQPYMKDYLAGKDKEFNKYIILCNATGEMGELDGYGNCAEKYGELINKDKGKYKVENYYKLRPLASSMYSFGEEYFNNSYYNLVYYISSIMGISGTINIKDNVKKTIYNFLHRIKFISNIKYYKDQCYVKKFPYCKSNINYLINLSKGE